ncbi:TadE/TadG family type IV pilus assembly protein [Kordiimonas lipolytica]|uniref:TadE/TadG family type IV pilus assembly protein n=1 Tax=Kordiimonas lipolytica TaxID=1662421 RepID=A0ABV8UDW2_9PROT|nr:TadE/TadG family type IV pilus assembly protein [Kordiimonas lipolytica]
MTKTSPYQRLKALLGRLRCRDDGVAAVEFAMTIPIYLGTIIMLIELSRIVYTQAVVLYAAEEATRYALVHYDATSNDVQAIAEANLLGLDPDNITAIIITSPVDPTDQTKLVTVEVQYQYLPILSLEAFLNLGDDAGLAITGESRGFLTEEIPY